MSVIEGLDDLVDNISEFIQILFQEHLRGRLWFNISKVSGDDDDCGEFLLFREKNHRDVSFTNFYEKVTNVDMLRDFFTKIFGRDVHIELY